MHNALHMSFCKLSQFLDEPKYPLCAFHDQKNFTTKKLDLNSMYNNNGWSTFSVPSQVRLRMGLLLVSLVFRHILYKWDWWVDYFVPTWSSTSWNEYECTTEFLQKLEWGISLITVLLLSLACAMRVLIYKLVYLVCTPLRREEEWIFVKIEEHYLEREWCIIDDHFSTYKRTHHSYFFLKNGH